MASSSKKWAKAISRFASQIYFLLIIFQIPLFRFPCRIGMCTTPMEVTSSQLMASEALPAVVVKTLLYPGAIAKAIFKKKAIPSYNNLLRTGKFTNMGKGPSKIDLKHMEVLAGSYFAVAGTFVGLIQFGRMSLFGIVLIAWGIFRELNFGRHATKDTSKEACMYSTMFIAVLSAFFSIRGDVRKLIRSSKLKYIIHPLKYSKAKMTSSFHTLNHPSSALGFISKQRSQSKVRRSPVLALPPSSIIPKTEESGNLPDFRKSSHSIDGNSGGFLRTQCNSVGVIGGVSVVSTLKFVKKLVTWSSEEEEENSSIPFVLCSDPVLSKELLLHERSSFSFLTSKGAHIERDHSPVVSNLKNKRIFLENSGAGCIVMPCHISHSWHDEVAEGCSVPFLHVGECVAKELKEAKLKPLEAGSPLRIGIMGTDATLAAGFYQDKLQNEGFEVVLPDKATMEHIVVPAVEAVSRKDTEGAQNLFRIALQVLLVRAVNTIILASDDMQDLLPPEDPLLKKCIDPMDALARSTIKHARSAERSP
ncbi:hypothetical protein ACH5RR_024584 [Cinchona calisaya]|uniref:Aspartate racemase n=1 Tax=Cinchona calisaya TaxID=153742 RepID=A0ABD2Z0B1_9GENT